MAGADGMSAKFMKSAFVGWTMTAGLYYPPDFDMSKLMPLKMLRPKGVDPSVRSIRMMFPFTMVCDACNEYNYAGTKFTSKCEEIKTECYLGIRVYRFYGRCIHCWADFTFKTDPKNSDYTMESGGKRTYEAWKDADMMEGMQKAEAAEEKKSDQMKALEQKAVDVAAELQATEDLDFIRTVNKRMGHRDLTIQEALDHLFKQDIKDKAAAKQLGAADEQELEVLLEAQEEMRRRKLDEQVEGSSSSIAVKTDTVFGKAAEDSGESYADLLRSVEAGSSDKNSAMRDKALAAAAAERARSVAASKPAVGARLAVKRKDGPAMSPSPEEPSEKKQCMGIGLGSYDSDSS